MALFVEVIENKCTLLFDRFLIMYDLCVFTCIIFIFVFHCTHVRMSYVLNSYLLTYLLTIDISHCQKRLFDCYWAVTDRRCETGCKLVVFTPRSRIRAFDWYWHQWPWMTLNGEATTDPRYLCGSWASRHYSINWINFCKTCERPLSCDKINLSGLSWVKMSGT